MNLALFLILGTGLHLTNKAVVLLTLYLLGVKSRLRNYEKDPKLIICLSQVTSGSLAYYVFDAGGRQLVGCSGGVYCLVGVYSSKTTYIPSLSIIIT